MENPSRWSWIQEQLYHWYWRVRTRSIGLTGGVQDTIEHLSRRTLWMLEVEVQYEEQTAHLHWFVLKGEGFMVFTTTG